jgi:hypothetical protein
MILLAVGTALNFLQQHRHPEKTCFWFAAPATSSCLVQEVKHKPVNNHNSFFVLITDLIFFGNGSKTGIAIMPKRMPARKGCIN